MVRFVRVKAARSSVAVVERVDGPVDLLAGLVALAEDGDRVGRPGQARRRRGSRRRRSTDLAHVGGACRGADRDRAPASTSARIAAGSSERGLSSVTTTTSAHVAAAAPIAAPLAAGRGRRRRRGRRRATPGSAGAARARAAATASAVWAKSTTASGAPSRAVGVGTDPLHPAGHVRLGEDRADDVVVGHAAGGQHERGHGGVDAG